MDLNPRRPGRPRLRPDLSHVDPAESILLIAGKQFAQRGYDATTVASIAEEVGLQRASIYHHFANKEAMLGEIARRQLGPVVALVGRFEGEEQARDLQLYRFLRIDVRYVLRSAYDLGRLFHLPVIADRSGFEALWESIDLIHDAWARWIDQAVAVGSFRVQHAGAASMLEASFLGVLSSPRQELADDAGGTADRFADLILTGLLADPRRLDLLRVEARDLDGPDPELPLPRREA